jgi:outer membrane protein assembly factor BamD
MLLLAGCHHKVQNPMAGIDSKQPDKGLYDRAMESMKKAHYTEARTLLETLINAYPDSEYIARAKLAVGDSWYNEGGTAPLKQAEVEYKDFQTFFPNMPEAAEAQLKVATIHYRQMEKADRDFSEALRAGEEYKVLIQQYPDSPLVPSAKQKLREVQEILADRQYRIAHFYYLRENLAASQARLQSLIESYPLYSGTDDALFDLGQIYEREAAGVRNQKMTNAALKEKLAAQFQKRAIEAYSKIITRYPAGDRAGDARHRLEALNAPVPTPTAEALAESKAEEQSRSSISMMQKVTGNFKKRPNMARTTRVGDPPMQEEKVESAVALVQELNTELTTVTQANIVGSGKGDKPGPNQPPPGSNSTKGASTNKDGSQIAEGAPPAPAPAQINEAAQSSSASTTNNGQNGQSGKDSESKQDSTSKKKEKKGLRKLFPF